MYSLSYISNDNNKNNLFKKYLSDRNCLKSLLQLFHLFFSLTYKKTEAQKVELPAPHSQSSEHGRARTEWIRKLWYIYTMEYYSVIKKNTFKSVLMRWMKLEPIRQSEVSQKEKHQYSIRTHIYGI